MLKELNKKIKEEQLKIELEILKHIRIMLEIELAEERKAYQLVK